MRLPRYAVALTLIAAMGCVSEQPREATPFERALAASAPRSPAPVDRLAGRVHFDDGVALQESGAVASAADRFTQATAVRPTMADAFVHRAAVRLDGAPAPAAPVTDPGRGFDSRESAPRDFAREDAEQALRVVTELRHPDAWVARGDAHRAAGDLARAIDDYSEALRISPHYWVAFVRRALARFDAGEFKAAAADFAARIELKPADASFEEAVLRLWACRVRLEGREAALVELKERLTELKGESAEIATFLVSGRSEYESASGALSARAWFYVGESRLAAGDTDGARKAFAEAKADRESAGESARRELLRLGAR